jgi:16S rRNA (uracil1498-N3)-methyltransferase
MIRLFIPPESISSNSITIVNDQSRYLSLVLRVQPGNNITVLDGQGYKYDCKLETVHKKEVVAKILNKTPYSVESPVSIVLAQGLPKADKMNLIIQKSTELGVRCIAPLITEHSQVRYTEKVGRWRKIALSASQQSGRDRIPDIYDPIDFDKFIAKKFSLLEKGLDRKLPLKCLIFSEGENGRNLKKVLSEIKNESHQIILLIGPEGGFSKKEVTVAVDNGFVEVSLGPRILRTETAPLAALSIIQYELGDIN